MKPKIAIVRGKFLNRYEMQFFELLTSEFQLTAFGSLTPYHDKFDFPVVKLPSPMDLPDFPYKMAILNRLFVDAHYLLGLEERLKGFDLVHTAETYFHYTQECLNAKKKGYVKKVIATVLENIPFNNEGIWGRKTFKRRARNELDHIIALTNKTKEALLAEGADPKKITVISHFIDTKKFYPGRRSSKTKNLNILFVGRLVEEKGVFEVVKAAYQLLRDKQLKDYHLHFRVIGGGGERKKIEKMIADLGMKKFITIGQATYDQMPEIYREAHISVAPSRPTPTWEEQYNTSLLEAQASGLPIVTTRTGGIPENIREAAVIVEPGNIGALTDSLKKFILNEKLRLSYGQKARTRALKVHDIRIGAQEIKELYQKVLA